MYRSPFKERRRTLRIFRRKLASTKKWIYFVLIDMITIYKYSYKGVFIMIWISLIVLAYFIILVPIQYNYIKILKEKQKKMNVSQNELYDNMSYEESQIHYHYQSNVFTIPASLVASILYKVKHANIICTL